MEIFLYEIVKLGEIVAVDTFCTIESGAHFIANRRPANGSDIIWQRAVQHFDVIDFIFDALIKEMNKKYLN